MRPLPPIGAEQCGVFSSSQANGEGWTESALRHAVRIERIRCLRTGAYQVVDLAEVRPDLSAWEEARWRHAGPGIGAALTTPGALASHSTAAVVLGMPLLFLPKRACVSVPPWLTGEVPKVHLHRCTRPLDRALGPELRCTPLERTLIDLAREHGVATGVVAADFALHLGLTSPSRLEVELGSCRRWPGIQAAREAVEFADARTESVLESRSRLALRDWGLPPPEPQARIGNEWRGFVARVDFLWPELGVAGEADGDVKYGGTDPTPLIEEKRRERRMADLELPTVRWGTDDLRDFGVVAARLRREFARAARTPMSARRWRILPQL